MIFKILLTVNCNPSHALEITTNCIERVEIANTAKTPVTEKTTLSEATTPTATNYTTTSTTTNELPEECSSATNLTESWRMDHNSSHIRPGGPNSDHGFACDFRPSLQWFRFTGKAGKHIS